MGKTEADDVKKIHTSFLNKHGYFNGFRTGTITWTHGWSENKSSVSIQVFTFDEDNQYLNIQYTQTDNYSGEKKDFDYKIPLTTTPCRYGGKRYWFTCPWYKSGVYCGRRVGTLYKDGDYFACRHCYQLTYSSRKVNRKYQHYPLFKMADLEAKVEELYKKSNRRTYAGRPTKTRAKIDKLENEIGFYYQHFKGL